jgi:hypothetical protein
MDDTTNSPGSFNGKGSKGAEMLAVCPECKKEAGRIDSDEDGPVTAVCAECNHNFLTYLTECPKCEVKTICDETRNCKHCDEDIHYVEVILHYRSLTDQWVYCDCCQFEFLPSVGYIKDQWTCFSCHTRFTRPRIHYSGYCGEYVIREAGENDDMDDDDSYPIPFDELPYPDCFMCVADSSDRFDDIKSHYSGLTLS